MTTDYVRVYLPPLALSSGNLDLGGMPFDLPLASVNGHKLAILDLLGDWELTEILGKRLALFVPYGTEALVMPDGKATALLHVVARELKLPAVVARKKVRPWESPAATATARSITSGLAGYHLSEESAAKLKGKMVTIVDDVISTGATVGALRSLLGQVGARYSGAVAVFTEGSAILQFVTSMGHLDIK